LTDNHKKSRRPISFRRWYPQFKQLANHDSEASNVLKSASNGVFHGTILNALLSLLYIYVCGAPTAAQFSKSMNQTAAIKVANLMDQLATALSEFHSSESGLGFHLCLIDWATKVRSLGNHETGSELQLFFGAPEETVGEFFLRCGKSYNQLPLILSTLSAFMKGIAGVKHNLLSISPPDRKRVQSRALALLYCHIRFSVRKSDYAIASDLAKLLRPAYQAANLPENDAMDPRLIIAHDAVEKRIRRFRKDHPKEFDDLKKIVETQGLNEAIALLLSPISNI
jgi:hypothetical protein